ncbi:hypothetical protein [Bacillus massiliigorillae]|uniref:hypothetical protein n=1 Tax=Bacillus massiliigorillae TaxID=1243664 RepID=UPI0003A8E605|nr:hypothetical protein [Bacillus massiliigorillae]
MIHLQLLRFLTIHYFSLNTDCNHHIAELLLIKKQQVNLSERYITLRETKVALNDLTTHCLGLLLPLINKQDDRLFINR